MGTNEELYQRLMAKLRENAPCTYAVLAADFQSILGDTVLELTKPLCERELGDVALAQLIDGRVRMAITGMTSTPDTAHGTNL